VNVLCQIDLILRSKHALHVVEIRRRKSIDLTVVNEVQEKVLRLPRDRSLSVRTALVYEGNLDPRVETEGYFDFLIPFARLLERA
jgi:Holliday junction resolvase-like predicted endonuclease